MSTTTSTNMGMVLPVPSSEAGPAWASELYTALNNILDSHDHTTGKGVKVPTSGLNINSDLGFNGFAASSLLKAAFSSQTIALTGTNFAYVLNGDLYFIDGNGTSVRFTAGGAINVASAGGFGGDYVSSGAIASFTNATKYYSFKDGSAVKAIIDSKGQQNDGKLIWTTTAVSSSPYSVATDDSNLLVDTSSARQINLPDPTSSKRVVWVIDSTGSAASNNITAHRFGTEKIQNVAADFVMKRNYGVWGFISNLTDWFVIGQSYPDLISYTVFDGSTTPGTDTIPTAFASPTLSASTLSAGSPITRSTNTLTFPYTGKYVVTLSLGEVTKSGAGVDVMARVRNTSDSTTSAVSIAAQTNSTSPGSPSLIMPISVVNTSKNYEVQWCTASATTTVSSVTVNGENSPRWRITIERIGD